VTVTVRAGTVPAAPAPTVRALAPDPAAPAEAVAPGVAVEDAAAVLAAAFFFFVDAAPLATTFWAPRRRTRAGYWHVGRRTGARSDCLRCGDGRFLLLTHGDTPRKEKNSLRSCRRSSHPVRNLASARNALVSTLDEELSTRDAQLSIPDR
jgi:hypothetical protein